MKPTNNLDAQEGKLPAGTYFVGDLSTILESDNWKFICDKFIPYSSKVETFTGILTDNHGKQFAIFRTMYGDGIFTDNKGNSYTSDSGSIGIYPVDESVDRISDSGAVHKMSRLFSCSYTESTGVIKFGSISINTKTH
jgi:hypothetical protein